MVALLSCSYSLFELHDMYNFMRNENFYERQTGFLDAYLPYHGGLGRTMKGSNTMWLHVKVLPSE